MQFFCHCDPDASRERQSDNTEIKEIAAFVTLTRNDAISYFNKKEIATLII
jgi:hypothetical protein